MTAPPSSDLPGILADRYVIERELGRGASAFVYLAHDLTHDRPVAVKVLRRELAESVGADRFLREVHVTARLQHPRIVSVLDAGAVGDQLFFVAPYMDGGTLRDRLARERQLPIGTAVAIAYSVATALDYAHAHGLIHRDVKPENILFAGDEPLLGDFGIARVLNDATDWTTSTGLVRGTPAYMSPEQGAGERALDARTDVYSLGVVLYEMLAGQPPFGAATAQGTIAQRFTHPPEPLTRYRPTVPAELEEVVRIALATAPADRFATARAFAEALAATGLAHSTGASVVRLTPPKAAAAAPPRGRRRALVALGIVAAGALGVWGASRVRDSLAPRPAAADTTQLLVLPAALGRGVPDAARPDELLYRAFSRWRGVSLADRFRVDDAAGGDAAVRTVAGARLLARQLGAGRYVRTRVERAGDSLGVYAAVFDVDGARPLYQITRRVALAASGRDVDATFAAMADSLLLRGAGLPGNAGTTSLPAAQAMLRARAALDAWNLVAADSALATALAYDAGATRAAYWLAQVRAWEIGPRSRWQALAAQAAADSARLPPEERPLAAALAMLGREDFADACRAYDALRRQRPSDFTAWFGLGQCHRMDHRVERDATSPSGWRFRSSMGRGVDAYARALELLPAAHPTFQGVSLDALAYMLYMKAGHVEPGSAIVRRGATFDTLQFIARPALVSDTLAFVPYPASAGATADPGTTPATLAAAARRGQERFRRIAGAWSAALPNSAATKEAVATSLEMLGDASTADTLRLARRLATDALQRTRLAVAEVLTTVKFALPDRIAELRRARALADSLIATSDTSADRTRLVLPLVTLTARCDLVPTFARRAAEPLYEMVAIPRAVDGDAKTLLAAAAIGCVPNASIPTTQQVADRIPRGRDASPLAEYTLLGRAVSLMTPLDSAWVTRFALTYDDYLLRAQRAALVHDDATARRVLRDLEPLRRLAGYGEVTPDAVVPEARLWLALGDSAAAEGALDAFLGALRASPPGMLADMASAASLTRAIRLRADLAGRRGAAQIERQWRTALLALAGPTDTPHPTR